MYEGGGDGDGTSSKHFSALTPGALTIWALLAAAGAGAVAIAAMVIGSRRKAKQQYHPLKGSLERRMKLFGGMADGCFEDRQLCGAQSEVERANSTELTGDFKAMEGGQVV
eukprot:CAMPEP_0181117116 /NCGR_PEP_ID=MMETSP1071-20121207/22327_1 /TAXON_ID=35127 /ORGANISM="Thalassiosira sp., Strain NH16" /LENGTH=110 /DNA_ID=CAMNT_0023201435 /DNA_START=183 /DNA_END=515 /DNA_ORIENTATION=+